MKDENEKEEEEVEGEKINPIEGLNRVGAPGSFLHGADCDHKIK